MKKIISLILTVALVFSLCTISFADEQQNVSGNFNPENCSTACQMYNADFDCIGSLFSTVAPATHVSLVCPSWSDNKGSLTVTLWKWNKDYKTTVAGTPVAGPETFEDYEDNSPLGFDFAEGSLLETGVYYIELSEAVDPAGSGVGVWSAQENYPGQAVFRDGEFVNKMCLRMYVNYASEIQGNPYGKLPSFDKPASELGSDAKDPSPASIVMKACDLSGAEGESNFILAEENEDGNLRLTVSEDAFDCQYSINFVNTFGKDEDEQILCAEYPYVAIHLKIADVSKNFGDGEAFFYTTSCNGATGGYSAAVKYDWKNPDWQTVVIDPTSNSQFKKNALNGDEWLGFRYDVLNGSPDYDLPFDIDWIAFFANEEAAMAFNGDFGDLIPTQAPATATPAPTEAPKATEAPATQAPTEAPKATEAPKENATDAPAENATEAPKTSEKTEEGGSNVVIIVVIAAVVVAAVVAGIIIAKKKK